jgi:hypothetical protein
MSEPVVNIFEVLDPKDQSVQLYDIYVDGKWYGSRRTLQQAELEVEYVKKKITNPAR